MPLEQEGAKSQSCHLAASSSSSNSNSIGAVCADDGGASSPRETQSVYHGHGTKSQSSRSPFNGFPASLPKVERSRRGWDGWLNL